MDDQTPLVEVAAFVEHGAENGGVTCPACHQFAKVYRRPLNSGMARSLITMWLAAGLDWQHVPTTVGGKSREEAKLRYWGLVEESDEERDDGGRAGYWRVTADGERFVHRLLTVPRYAYVYDGVCRKVEGEPTDIISALGRKFDYAELMAAPAVPLTIDRSLS